VIFLIKLLFETAFVFVSGLILSHFQTRLVPGAVDTLIQMLEWTGISIDEGNTTYNVHKFISYNVTFMFITLNYSTVINIASQLRINNNNNNILRTMFIVLSSWLSHFEVHLVHLMYVAWRQLAANPQTKPVDLGRGSAFNV